MRKALRAFIAAAALAAAPAHAQTDFPNRRIHMIVPYPAGGIVDIVTRIVTDKLSEIWRQPIVVEAKPGASGNIAWDQVARAEPDGYTWTFVRPGTLANPGRLRAARKLKEKSMNAPATQPTISVGGFSIDILVQGFPGKTVCHGGLGWSTVALVRGQGRVVLIDAGNFGMRRLISERLSAHGLSCADVTDVILTHAHYDHSINWPMFSTSRILIGKGELEWAVKQPLGHHTIPEFYVRELAVSKQLHNVEVAEEVLPGLTAYAAPGHTPGHLVYVLNGGERDVIFSGDAAKNRAEMLSLTADMTMNAADSRATMERIWEFWRRKPGSILVPGHDVPMRLENDEPVYIAKRTAGISAWFGRKLEETTLIELKV